MALDSSKCKPGQEQHEVFKSRIHRNKQLVQYDYRHPDGTLFSCIADTLSDARKKRNEWMKREGKPSFTR